MRLDLWLVNQKYFESRNKAQNAILNKLVLVNNKIIDKPHYLVSGDDKIKIIKFDEYVSRGAYKLLAAIKHWNINLKDKIVLDIGASTGGFSDVCIKQNCKYVYSVDVGTNQLHHSLRNNTKIKSYENMNFKNVAINMFQHNIDYVVCDVSFISLTKIIDKLINLFDYKYKCVFLIKPQFELSPKEIKNGKVNQDKLLLKAIDKIKIYGENNNFKIFGVLPSPIKGDKLGNQEFLIYMEKR